MSNLFLRLIPFCFVLLLSACSTIKQTDQAIDTKPLTNEQRRVQAEQLKQWQITGKLAFITKEKRESANLFWQLDQTQQNQLLKLTTYLGINVLSLTSNNGLHTVEVDGNSYQGTDLTQLIYELTGLVLPTQAMQYWLKGISWSPLDKVITDRKTGLPMQLSSFYNGRLWHISYHDYQLFNQLPLAKKITIKQNDSTIKILLNQWIF